MLAPSRIDISTKFFIAVLVALPILGFIAGRLSAAYGAEPYPLWRCVRAGLPSDYCWHTYLSAPPWPTYWQDACRGFLPGIPCRH